MTGRVPLQTETRSASQRRAAGQAAYPAVASPSSQNPDSSPAAAAPSYDNSNAFSNHASSTQIPNESNPRNLSRTSVQSPSVPEAAAHQQGSTLASESTIPNHVTLDSLAQAQVDTTGPVISAPTMALVTHNVDPRPFLSPVLRAQPSARVLASDLYLPVMPSVSLPQFFPSPLNPTRPTLPSLRLDLSLPQNMITPSTERDIIDHRFDAVGNQHCTDNVPPNTNPLSMETDITDRNIRAIEDRSYNEGLFPSPRSSERDAEILFPELEANRFRFQNPSNWSLPARPRDPNELCESLICPIRGSAHNEGLYLFEGQQSAYLNPTFGRSNPPPFIWLAYNRILEAHEEQEDRLHVWGFTYCHRS